MGAGYSATTLKTNLKMCSSRMLMHRNKKSNASTVESKAVAVLLQQGKDESARIRVEMILHERNLASAMEILTLMCDLLHARVALITNSKTCPADLEEGIASIIYCANRVEIPELKNISEQFASKYGKEWVMNHLDNQSGKVNGRVIEKLSIQPPAFDLILNTLHEIAATYNIEWKPDMDALEAGIVDASNPERLGSIAKIDLASQPGQQPANQQNNNGGVQPIAVPNAGGNPQYPSMLAQPPSSNNHSNHQVRQQFSPDPNIHLPSSVTSNSSQSALPQYPIANVNLSAPVFDQSGTSPGSPSLYPGSLNIIVHRARNVINLSSQSDPHDLYIRISNRQTGASWHSEADPVGGAEPIWMNNPNLPSNSLHHFSVAIADPTVQIQIEIVQKNTGAIKLKEDKVLGTATFYADNLRASPQLQWYGLYAQSMCIGYVLFSTQYIPTNAVVLSKEELDRQQHIQMMQQQAQQMLQHNPSPQVSPNAYNSSPPGGPTQQTTSSSTVTSYEYNTASISPPPPQPASYDFTQAQSSREAGMPNAPYQPLADGPAQHQQQQQPQFREEKSNYDIPQGEAGEAGDDSSAILDAMPDVPKHDLNKKRGSGSSGSHGGGGSAGGGTLYAPPPAAVKKNAKHEEDDLAERFRKLQ